MATTAQIAAAYAAREALELAEKQKTQAVEAWVASFSPTEQPLCLERSKTSRNPSKSHSDRRVGLNGKIHRIERACRRHAVTVTYDRERDFQVAEERTLRSHFTHHIGVALATARDAGLKANNAINQYCY